MGSACIKQQIRGFCPCRFRCGDLSCKKAHNALGNCAYVSHRPFLYGYGYNLIYAAELIDAMTGDLLFSRIDDMLSRSENGIAAYSPFLNETEREEVRNYLKNRSGDFVCRFFGGYEDAERTRLFIYPDYYEFEDVRCCIGAVLIKGSGYNELKHSSFLGALTALGIDRAKMGDIVVLENEAVLFADESIVRFLLSEPSPLTSVGRDKVKVTEFVVTDDFTSRREFKDIFDTVASPRLDCIAAALAGLSREKAKALIRSGNVMVNHIPRDAIDITVSENDTLTLRGYGKFIIISLADKTKKDRYKLIAKKYI